MDQILDPANAEHFDKVLLYFGSLLGMGGFFWLLYRVFMFMSHRSIAILNGLTESIKEIINVLKKLEVAVEVLQKTQENSEKRLGRLEDIVYTNLSKTTKK